ncbi:MAG TPA: DUF721 domain-containing protein [Alphaproteobacteria bacterium]|jgi:hypothetical protein
MSGPRLISDSIPRVAGQVFSKKYIMLGRLVTRWAEIVGADLGDKTQPVKIRYYKKKGQQEKAEASLDIATGTADATLLHYRKDLILERINQMFGDRWITSVRFVPMASNAPPPRLKKTRLLTEKDKDYLSASLETVTDPEMQEKLKSFGTAMLKDL